MRRLCGILTLFLTAGALLPSCDNAIYDAEGDCSVRYRVRFRYAKNILGADAFGPQVTAVHLFLYDRSGTPVYRRSQQRVPTADNDFFMEVDVPPGRYDLLAWCEGQSPVADAVSFAIDTDAASMTGLGAALPLRTGDGALPVSDRDIRPLYHGLSRDVDFPDTYGTVDLPAVELTKDTNRILVQLQQTGSDPLDEKSLSIALEGRNSELDYLNRLAGRTEFLYRPWALTGISASFEETEVRGETTTNGLQAELTTGRILADAEQMLTVRRTDTGEAVFSIPLVKYLLLVRGEYEQATSNQDYLDRCDDYSLVFFLQDGYTWIKTRMLINGWRVVPPQSGSL